MSAQSQLQGLYPVGPTLNQWQKDAAFPKFLNNFGDFDPQSTNHAIPGPINVIPVHLFNKADRKYFYLSSYKYCPPQVDKFNSNIQVKRVSDFMDSFETTATKLIQALKLEADYFSKEK